MANITTPAIELSTDYVDFGSVKCGECHIISVQLYNGQQVTCHWDTTDYSAASRRKHKASVSTEFFVYHNGAGCE